MFDDRKNESVSHQGSPFDPEYLRSLAIEAAGNPALEWMLDPAHSDQIPPDEVCRGAYRMVLPIGQALVTGGDIGFKPSELRLNIALGALAELVRRAESLLHKISTLDTDFDGAADTLEIEHLACQPLIEAFDQWAVFLALDRRIIDQMGHTDQQQVEDLVRHMDCYIDLRDKCSQAMERHIDLLTCALDTNLLSNLRSSLATEYQALAPWWLTGRLEARAQEIWGEFQRPLISPLERQLIAEHGYQPDVYAFLGPAPLQVAAAASAPQAIPPPIFHLWKGPNGLTAEMYVFVEASDNEPLQLAFLLSDDSPALELAGRKVVLAGVESDINQQAVAAFKKADLRQARGRRDWSLQIAGMVEFWYLERPGPGQGSAGQIGDDAEPGP